jgi:hypothetical protein
MSKYEKNVENVESKIGVEMSKNVEKCREQNVATYRHVVFENV